ncbi:hypothetical protein [Pelomonas sp. KK5]|uniref:hypothetical protein n=1 Tax=Pelomonas sp. KK5 TaxID=1855730 RepID=UPI00097BE065|nr:hypothetical protein [Pelomonas sp. KK5]
MMSNRHKPSLARWICGAAGAVCLSLLAACGGGGGGGDSGASGSGGPGSGGAAQPPADVASAAASADTGTGLLTLSSDAGDYIGQGRSYSYDASNATLRLDPRGAYLRVTVSGAESWDGDFQLPDPLHQLTPGTYENLTRSAFQPAGAGALSWSGQGRGCNTLTGKVVINSVSYSAGLLQALDMSFEQHCEGGGPALHGRLRLDAAAMSRVLPPRNPLPANPVVSLVSDSRDYIGAGGSYAYDNGTASIQVRNTDAHLSISVNGDEDWQGEFQLPAPFVRWQPGRYTALTRYPFQPSGAGAMSWGGEGRGCNTLTAKLTVNAVRYDGDTLAAIDLDFEQHCEGGAPALSGHIAWDAQQAAASGPGPQLVPAGLWAPGASEMPATGNAMVLVSDPGDYIGQGWTYKVNPPAGETGSGSTSGRASVTVTEAGGLLTVKLSSSVVSWTGELKAMDGLAHMQPGYYGIVNRYPFHNPRKGGMDWDMDSRGCNALSGWFAIDSIRYSGDTLAAVDLRFAQYCDNSLSALRGRVRWTAGGSQPQ